MWYWKQVDTITTDYPLPDSTHAETQISASGELESWDIDYVGTGVIGTQRNTVNVDETYIDIISPFESEGVVEDYSYFRGVHTDCMYSVYANQVAGNTYFTITRRNKAGVTQGQKTYYLTSYEYWLDNVVEISSTHMVLIFIALGQARESVVPIPTSVSIIQSPVPNIQNVIPLADSRSVNHQPNYHATNVVSTGNNLYHCNTITGTITSLGPTALAGDISVPMNHLNPTNFPESWVVNRDYTAPNYSLQVSNMLNTTVGATLQYPYSVMINEGQPNEYVFQRGYYKVAAPPVTGFPILISRETTEFFVPDANGTYTIFNPVTEWNIDQCELWAFVEPAYYALLYAYVGWYIDRNNVYILTRDNAAQYEIGGDTFFVSRLFKYVGIGTMSVGPAMTTSHRTDNKYGR